MGEVWQESGFAIDGKTVNGFVNQDGVTINIQSAKSLNSVVGHEITHVLEGTDFYEPMQTALFEYAKSKNDFDSRRAALSALYKGMEADIDAELTADLVGDYLFSDSDFVSHLAAGNRNVFQKVYDEVKYLCKTATAGSKEARKLEEVKRKFEEVYRGEAKAPTETKYALSQNASADVHNVLQNKNFQGEVKLADNTPSILLSQKGVKNLPMVMKASHIRENVFTEAEAKAKGLQVNKGINYHGLGEDLFLNVVDGLDDVKEAYRGTKNADNPNRRENYFLLISEQTDKDGNTINVPVFINEKALHNQVFIDTNKIATVFGRSELREYINRQLAKGNIVRVKKRSTQSSESASPIDADYRKGASSVAGQSVESDTPTTTTIAPPPPNVNTQHSISSPDKPIAPIGKWNIRGEYVELKAPEARTDRFAAPIGENVKTTKPSPASGPVRPDIAPPPKKTIGVQIREARQTLDALPPDAVH